MYEQAAQQQAASGSGGDGPGGPGGPSDDEVVDAEIVDDPGTAAS
jgi:hypothetical protein